MFGARKMACREHGEDCTGNEDGDGNIEFIDAVRKDSRLETLRQHLSIKNQDGRIDSVSFDGTIWKC